MTTLAESWKWYLNNKKSLQLISRLGETYWNDLPWDGKLGNDDHFRLLEGVDVKRDADAVLAEFDDLAIFVIFSVFEAIVRDRVKRDVLDEVANLQHPALKRTAGKMMQNIEEGSFYNNVLDLFKVGGDEATAREVNSLVEEVSRVRRYRNWVAHGRRPDRKKESLLPRDAFDVLEAFLDHIAAGSTAASIMRMAGPMEAPPS